MNAADPTKTVQPSDPEPVAERWTIPMWLIIVFALMVYGCALFMAESAGGFAKDVYNPYHTPEAVYAANPHNPNDILKAEGRKVFEGTCAACHQSSGLGQDGKAPPLAGSEWVLASSGDRIARAVMNGLSGSINVKGKQWDNLSMVAWRDNFTDEQIAAVLTYIRSSWGNNASPVSPDLIKEVRAEKHPGPMSPEELQKIPLKPANP